MSVEAPPVTRRAMVLDQGSRRRLKSWLVEHLDANRSADLVVDLIEGGRSNLTFFVTVGDQQWVLRRPPLGQLLPTAHSMKREFTVLRSLKATEVPVPRALAFCNDETVIGAPFYVMERLDGLIVRSPDECRFSPDQAHRSSLAIVRTLGALHGVRYGEAGLAEFGRPEGFMKRQLERWHRQLEQSRIRPLPDLDELGGRLALRLPEHTRAAVVHGDYRIDNLMLDHNDPGRIIAVLDWEMATIGDPLTDLGMLLMYWGEAGEVAAAPIQAVTAAPGFLSRAEVVREYERYTGLESFDLDFYTAFAYFKLAVIVEGIHARVTAGDTVGGGFEIIESIAPRLATRGLGVLS